MHSRLIQNVLALKKKKEQKDREKKEILYQTEVAAFIHKLVIK